MKFTQKTFENILIMFLVCGCVLHPFASALGLLILGLTQIAERYFTKNISDVDRGKIQTIKTELDKHSVILQKEVLSKAFGGQR